jgi:uncharacterized protein DUF3465
MRRAPFFVAACGASALAAACGASVRADNAAAFSDIQSGRSGDEVTVEGVVTHVGRASRGDSGVHEHFDIRISSGAAEQDILVADNITVGVQAPVKRGDDVIVRGVLEIDPSGPVIHWTHHDPANRHESGFVMLGGRMYE